MRSFFASCNLIPALRGGLAYFCLGCLHLSGTRCLFLAGAPPQQRKDSVDSHRNDAQKIKCLCHASPVVARSRPFLTDDKGKEKAEEFYQIQGSAALAFSSLFLSAFHFASVPSGSIASMENTIRRMSSTAAPLPAEHTDKKERSTDYDSSSDNDHSTVVKDVSDKGSVRETPGVKRMEAFARATKGRKKVLFGLAVAVYIVNWVYSMENSTTYAYAIWATSDFQQHAAGISATNIAARIVSSVCLPCKLKLPFRMSELPYLRPLISTFRASPAVLAKFADVFSRPLVYLISLVCYVVGFIIIAFSPNLAACGSSSFCRLLVSTRAKPNQQMSLETFLPQLVVLQSHSSTVFSVRILFRSSGEE